MPLFFIIIIIVIIVKFLRILRGRLNFILVFLAFFQTMFGIFFIYDESGWEICDD